MDNFNDFDKKPEGGYTVPFQSRQSEYEADNNDEKISLDSENFWEGVILPKPKEKRLKKRIAAQIFLCLVMLSCGFGIAMVTARGSGWLSNLVTGDKHTTFTLPINDKPTDDDKLKDEDGKYTSEGLAKALSPSVVSLEVFTDSKSFVPSGQGSGVIISKNGYIVTNAHVVAKAVKIKAVLNDLTEYEAKLVGAEAECDLAVIKISAQDLQPAEFGNSDQVNLGEEVMTIGSPAGFYGSVTKGIVSGLGRVTRLESGNISDCLQIDAAINPGNSGGALFNMWGQVIGITSSKLSSSDYDGIGFAISSNYAKPVVEDIMAGKIREQGVKIGISYYVITEETAKMQNSVAGLAVKEISENSGAAKSGLKVGDIITEIDGQKTVKMENISEYIRSKGAGKYIKCHVYRQGSDGKFKEYDFDIEIMKDDSIVEK